ncbi:hypothetical protein JCM4814A_79050 [Streptomyces phaeofaciens JCM 4814]|uniref:Uncharacterized protein n=2 Tax=Streptomyces phaeofaciens TaxID=68254 RepID=A0A918M149_9ACTN|nr:hypothetical protein GCM10010226_92490 [Streptomyces phaeofaciens]
MTSISPLGGQGENLPEPLRRTFDEMIADAEKELAVQQDRLRQMHRRRRRRQYRDAARRAREHSRAGLFWGGSAACAAGAVFALLGMYDIAMELLKAAVAAWIAAASAAQPPRT